MSKTKITFFLLMLLGAACASLVAKVPDKLKPGANESLAMIVAAKGVQIYECRATKDPSKGYEWAFVAPEADLFDARGNRVGRHYGGPHWESTDGSRILGTVKERADAPMADAIPWLLLSAKSVGPEGSFSKVISIQRLNTVSGVAPTTGCSQAAAESRRGSITRRTITSSPRSKLAWRQLSRWVSTQPSQLDDADRCYRATAQSGQSLTMFV